jgi:hypothetical protein
MGSSIDLFAVALRLIEVFSSAGTCWALWALYHNEKRGGGGGNKPGTW